MNFSIFCIIMCSGLDVSKHINSQINLIFIDAFHTKNENFDKKMTKKTRIFRTKKGQKREF